MDAVNPARRAANSWPPLANIDCVQGAIMNDRTMPIANTMDTISRYVAVAVPLRDSKYPGQVIEDPLQMALQWFVRRNNQFGEYP
jgi:hypothetical protein